MPFGSFLCFWFQFLKGLLRYISALPFAPQCSLVGENFRPRFPNTLTITDGRPSQRPKTIFTAEHYKDPVWCISLSLDERAFASISKISYKSAFSN